MRAIKKNVLVIKEGADMADKYFVTINTSMNPVEKVSLEDRKCVRITVNVNTNTVYDSETGEKKRLWQVPTTKIILTRHAYQQNPNILFALLNKALPRDRWASLKWTRGHVERVDTLVWPMHIPVTYEEAKFNLRGITRIILDLNEDDIPYGPVRNVDQTFWIYQNTEPVSEDLKKVQILVNVNSKKVGRSETGEEKKLEISLTRRAYQENENILFVLLNKALPQDKWARLQWTRGPVESAFPQLFTPYYISVTCKEAKQELRKVTRSILYLDDDDISMGPVSDIIQTFWIYQHTDPA